MNRDSFRNDTPFILTEVNAGFPSPANDYLEEDLNLHNILIKNKVATFLMRAQGDSMKNVGIFQNSLLIVDRSKTHKHNDIVIAEIDGGLVVKRFYQKKNSIILKSENEEYPSFIPKNQQTIVIWGVVTAVINQF